MSEDITSLQLKPYRIQRTYMKTPKYTLSLYIPPAETTVVNNGYNIGVIGILYFQLPWQESKIKRSIEIRVKNQRKILRCLSEALNWFDNIVDLFVTQDNVLYFNTNYNNLSSKYKSDPDENPQAIKIVPVALECGNGIYEEGVILSVNSIDNYIQLTRDELQELFDVIYNFNFSTEILLTYQALQLSILMGRFGSQGQNFNNKFLK